MMPDLRRSTRIAFGVLVLFLIASYKNGVATGFWYVACGVVGFANASCGVRLVAAAMERRQLLPVDGLLAAAAMISSLVVILSGYGVALVLASAALAFMCAIARWRRADR